MRDSVDGWIGDGDSGSFKFNEVLALHKVLGRCFVRDFAGSIRGLLSRSQSNNLPKLILVLFSLSPSPHSEQPS